MKTTTLPEPIELYLRAANAGNGEEAAAAFTPDALVHDESNDHHGGPAIREWVEETTRKYQPQLTVLRAEETDGHVSVAAQVSGNFPGSPAELHFAFTLREELIAHLVIE